MTRSFRSLADRLNASRHAQFVGRTAEQALWRELIKQSPPTSNILHLYGPGGIGKTSLLHEFQRIAHDANIRTIWLNAVSMEASPLGFKTAVSEQLQLENVELLSSWLQEYPERFILFVDEYESLQHLDDWLRHHFLPQLPADAIIVLSGRKPPRPAWESDAGWRELMHQMPLRNLAPDETATYLTHHQIPTAQQQIIQAFTHGYPLAIALVADLFNQQSVIDFQPADSPEIISKLVHRFASNVPSSEHRAALEATALARMMTEQLLADMLQISDARSLFEWLSRLSFIEIGRQGIYPNRMARETLSTDLRWRNPDWYAELHRRARSYYMARLRHAEPADQEAILIDYVFFHRQNPVAGPIFEQLQSGNTGLHAELPEPEDWPKLGAMIRQFEGDQAAQIAAHWFEAQPEGTMLFRDDEQQLAGLLSMVNVAQTTPAQRQLDPAIQQAWDYLQAMAPLRAGEQATFFRFWLDANNYQEISAVQNVIFIHMVRHYIVTPNLAYTFLPCAQPEAWQQFFAYADLHLLPELAFTLGDTTFGVYGHDWRVCPPTTWLELLAAREATGEVSPPPASFVQPVVLSRPAFETAVRHALRHFTRPDQLQNNPLLHARLLMESKTTSAVAQLQAMLQEAAQLLQHSPRSMKHYRAVHHTYFTPAPTQEKAAELLDIPYATFRRHLTAGVTQIVDSLWQQEIGRFGA